MKGKVKEMAGKFTSNRNFEVEGKAEHNVGKVEKKVGQIKKCSRSKLDVGFYPEQFMRSGQLMYRDSPLIDAETRRTSVSHSEFRKGAR